MPSDPPPPDRAENLLLSAFSTNETKQLLSPAYWSAQGPSHQSSQAQGRVSPVWTGPGHERRLRMLQPRAPRPIGPQKWPWSQGAMQPVPT